MCASGICPVMMELPRDCEVQRLSSAACLKAAVHYTVGRICESMAEREDGLPVQRQTVAALSELVHGQVCRAARDLEMLSRHSRRTTVSAEDVLFMVRNTGVLHDHLQGLLPPPQPKKADGRRKGSAAKERQEP